MTQYYVYCVTDKVYTVEADSKQEALSKALDMVKSNPPMTTGGYYGAELAGTDGPIYIAPRPMQLLDKPYAVPVPKHSRRRY